MTIGQLFLHQAKVFSHRRFIYKPDLSSVTYEQAIHQIANWVQQMQSYGIKKGDHLICYSEAPDPTIYFFLAAQFLGAIIVPVSPLFSTGYINDLATRIDSRFIFCDEAIYPGCTLTRLLLTANSDLPLSKFSSSEAYEFLEQIHEGANCNDILMLQSTAGSTGTPKLVIRKHSALTHYAVYLKPQLRNKNRDAKAAHRYLMLLSFAHSFAYHQLTTAISLGAELAVPNGIDADVELQQVYQLAPTVLSLPPRVLRSFLLQDKKSQKILPGKKLFSAESQYVVIGGGEGDAATLRRLQLEGITPVQIYSTSETSMIAITGEKKWQENSTGSVLPSVELKFLDDGEICVKSPGLMVGYQNDEKATAEAFDQHGFFKTGDVGAWSSSGQLKILGRKKDVFNTPEGSNIFPSRIEEMIELASPGCQVLLIGDSRPYLSALITLPPLLPWNSDHELGLLAPENYLSIYQKVGELLQTINKELERPEMIMRFHLYLKKFPEKCYQKVQGAKIRRDRIETARIFSAEISQLYGSPSAIDVTFVPGINRRLRKTA